MNTFRPDGFQKPANDREKNPQRFLIEDVPWDFFDFSARNRLQEILENDKALSAPKASNDNTPSFNGDVDSMAEAIEGYRESKKNPEEIKRIELAGSLLSILLCFFVYNEKSNKNKGTINLLTNSTEIEKNPSGFDLLFKFIKLSIDRFNRKDLIYNGKAVSEEEMTELESIFEEDWNLVFNEENYKQITGKGIKVYEFETPEKLIKDLKSVGL